MALSRIIIGTRRSKLALWQSHYVQALLSSAFPTLEVTLKEVITKGDITLDKALPAIGGKGLFTAELEEELKAGTIDIAVHSLKDLPVAMDRLFTLGATVTRVVRDVLVSRRGETFLNLPMGATIGSSSPRRESQLRRIRSDLEFRDIRGNIDTRIRKVKEGQFDGAILAEAGLARLGLLGEVAHFFTLEEILPAPGQGALAIQRLSSREDLNDALSVIHDVKTSLEVSAERSFLSGLGGGCSTPVGALATLQGNLLTLRGRVLSPKGERCIEVAGEKNIVTSEGNALTESLELGMELAQKALRDGAQKILGIE